MFEHCVEYLMLEGANSTITTKDAMTIGTKYWFDVTISKTINIYYAFKPAGLQPLCFPVIQSLLNILKDGGTSETAPNSTWMRCCETVRTEMLSLTSEIDICQQRIWTYDVNNSLLSCEQFNQTEKLLPHSVGYVATLMLCHELLITKIGGLDSCCWWILYWIAGSIRK